MGTLLAIDLGTTTIKGAVLDMDALSITHIQRVPFPELMAGLPDLFCEIDITQIIRTMRHLINALLSHAPECQGIVMCGQMGGLILSDAQGQPLSHYISWRDQRLLMAHPSGDGTDWDHFARRVTDDDRRRLGNEVRPGLTLSFLYWLAEHGQLPTQPVIAAALPDFVLANLCGMRPATEITDAVGALNIETGEWHHDLFARLGLSQVEWPTLCHLREPIGTYNVAGLSLPCFAPAGDHQTSVAGTFLKAGELSLNISTGSQASLLSDTLQHGSYQIRPYFDGLYLNTITHIPAGRALNVLLGLLSELAEAQQTPIANPWPYITQAVAATPDTNLGIDLAFFPSPVGERGALSNIHEGNLSIGHLFRAAFDAMAANYVTCATRLSPTKEWERIVFSGGLPQSVEALRTAIVDRFGCGYRLSASSEDALLGLLALGLVVTSKAVDVQTASAKLAAVEEAGRWPK
jgi:sugar (pentulose or hexulose) kinase